MGPHDGGWDVSSNATSYIDDGCPTVWQGSAPSPDQSRRPAGTANGKRQALDSTPRNATRVKPIDGDLLQRLFRATMDEKRRAAEANRSRQVISRDVEYVLEAKPPRSDAEPGGFYLPEYLKREAEEAKGRTHDEARGPAGKTAAQQKMKGVEEPQWPVKEKRSTRKSNADTEPHGIRVLGRSGEEAYVDLPLLPVEEETPDMIAEEEAMIEADEQDLDLPTKVQDIGQGHKKTKKQRKKKGKKQQENNDRATAAKLAAHAIMSGALLAENEDAVIHGRVASPEHSARASSAGIMPTSNQPESPHSRRDDQRRAAVPRSDKSTSTRSKSSRPGPSPVFPAPSTRATSFKVHSKKADSFVSFEEIGQDWAGEPLPRHGSKTSEAKANSGDSAKWSAPQSKTGQTAIPSYIKTSRFGPARSDASAKLTQPRVRDWKDVAQSSVAGARPSEAQDEWRTGPGTEYHAPSVRSLEGAATGWNESNADRPSQETRSSLHSRLVSIDGGKAVALDWGEETLAPSQSDQIAAKNLFNIPILDNIEPTEAVSAQAFSRGSKAHTSSENPSWQGSPSSRRSRASGHDMEELQQPLSVHVSQSASAHDFEEVGSGWYQATPEAGRSYASRSRSRSRLRTSVKYWVGQASQSDAQTMTASKHCKAGPVYDAKEDGEGWAGHERADSHHAHPRTDFPGQSSIHDWANTSQKSRGSHERNSNVVKDRGQASVNSGYGWANEHRSRQCSGARSEEQGSFKRPAASSRHSLSEPNYTYRDDDGEEDDQAKTAWPGTESEKDISDRSQPRDPREHPTIFAGKGWISPHPLSEAPSAVASPPQSKIVLPNKAFPQGATMTYAEWQQMQEQGLRLHRNFSHTESDQTRRGKRHHRRYKFAGWGAESSDGHRFEHESSRQSKSEHSRSDKSRSERTGVANDYRAPTVTSENSSGPMLSAERPRTITSNMVKDDRSIHESHSSSKRESLLSRIRTLTSWSQNHSGSKQAYDGSEGTHSPHRSSHRSSGGSGSRHHSDEHSSPRHPHRSPRHKSDHRSRHTPHQHSRQSSDRRSRRSSSMQEREMEDMEEGRKAWSEGPEEDGTASREQDQEWKATGEGSRTATSQLYLNRYRAESEASNRYEV